MAGLNPSLNTCLRRMHPGEKRFARCLEHYLEDDYLCWYEPALGKSVRYTDFVILHPSRGLLLLEVKDWKLEIIKRIDRDSATILTNHGLKVVCNPLEQARQCLYQLLAQFEKDPQLREQTGSHRGHLVFPYAFGVVLTQITREQFNSTDLNEVLPPRQILCKDEIVDHLDPEYFQKRLWDMFEVPCFKPLTLPQIDRIRWHLFPEIRIDTPKQRDLFSSNPGDEKLSDLVPDIVKVMDTRQESLARGLGDGHRVIHGVAGSGKTLILGYRCLYLAKILHKPILVLCYNIALAARLREMLKERGATEKVQVHHFHEWCGEQLRSYHVEGPERNSEGYYKRLVDRVITAAEKGRIPRGQYGAVMIDEGHDFEPDWLKLIVTMVDGQSNSLLLLYDDAQSIYKKHKTLDFNLSDVGIQARGRTTVLRLNYRNTQEILHFAYRFASQYLDSHDQDEDHIPLIEPQSIGRHGPRPVLKSFTSYEKEADYIARIFRKMHDEQSIPWSDLCATYPNHRLGEQLAHAFESQYIPFQWLHDSTTKKSFKPGEQNVKLMTMQSSKGLEFPVVAVSGAGHLPGKQMTFKEAAKLLYVAFTRSTEKLLVTAQPKGAIFEQLFEALNSESQPA